LVKKGIRNFYLEGTSQPSESGNVVNSGDIRTGENEQKTTKERVKRNRGNRHFTVGSLRGHRTWFARGGSLASGKQIDPVLRYTEGY